MRKDQVAAYMKSACKGRKHTKRSRELERDLNLSGTDFRKLVNRLRRDGVPIASSRDGYFYAQNAAEVYSTIRQLNNMIRGLEAAVRGLEAALEKFQKAEEGSAP